MGPITIFDKSFLQSLSVDESVWFDNYFTTNIVPLFFVETLSDLEKKVREGRTPEQEVGIIAAKTPEMHSSPNIFHTEMCTANMLGHIVPMDGRIMMRGGNPVKGEGKTGVVFEESPEVKAFNRWQSGEFLGIEREQAKYWRSMLKSLDFDSAIKNIQSLGITTDSCKSLEEVKLLSDEILSGSINDSKTMKLALDLFSIPEHLHQQIFRNWQIRNCPPIKSFAPYTAFMLNIDLFFYIAVSSSLISKERVTNKVDIAYLYYLPFCSVFVSSDKLHRRCAKHFIKPNQRFIWGFDLKDGLKEVDEYFDELSKEEKDKGVFSFASEPPQDDKYFITKLYDDLHPSWRTNNKTSTPLKKETNDALLEDIKKISEAPTLKEEEIDFDVSNPDSMVLKRRISKRKGKWFQVDKDIKSD